MSVVFWFSLARTEFPKVQKDFAISISLFIVLFWHCCCSCTYHFANLLRSQKSRKAAHEQIL